MVQVWKLESQFSQLPANTFTNTVNGANQIFSADQKCTKFQSYKRNFQVDEQVEKNN